MDDRQSKLRSKAMDWLGRREYSRHEIERKLQRFTQRDRQKAARRKPATDAPDADTVKALDANLISQVLDWLEANRFVDDTRCAALYVRSHRERGHGPLRIRQELVFKRGLDAELIEQQLDDSGVDWFALAVTTLQRRFRQPPDDIKQKTRQLRFLQRRGFSAEQCYHALDAWHPE